MENVRIYEMPACRMVVSGGGTAHKPIRVKQKI